LKGLEKSSATRAISHQFAQRKKATGWLGWLLRKLTNGVFQQQWQGAL
jgi:hypothetical protein